MTMMRTMMQYYIDIIEVTVVTLALGENEEKKSRVWTKYI